MSIQDLKDQMTLEDIGEILEDIGCENIKIHGNMLTSTKGEGSDNLAGVVIWDNGNFFNAEMYTTPEFDKFPVKDIFAVVQQITGWGFSKAMAFVENKIEFEEIEVADEKPKLLQWLDKIESQSGRRREKQPYNYKTTVLDSFVKELHPLWANEGITEEIADEFDIRFDTSTMCIIIPIYDGVGNLVGAKARETRPSNNKYCYVLKCRKSLVLYGLYQNEMYIKEAGEVIVFEAEKSVLKAASMGIRNAVAIGGKIISTEQAELLNRLGAKIVLALDEDVGEKDINENVRKLSFPFPLNDVYVLRDKRLEAKESPADRKKVMMEYKNHIKKETNL